MLIPLLLAIAGTLFEAIAILNERRMQRHRLPGVSYWDVTLRKDGGWRRTDLFAPEGLVYQHRAARYGVFGIACWLVAAISWFVTVQLRA